MKKIYEKVEIDVTVFEKKDIITASAQPQEHDNAYVSYSLLFNDFFSG